MGIMFWWMSVEWMDNLRKYKSERFQCVFWQENDYWSYKRISDQREETTQLNLSFGRCEQDRLKMD